MSLSPPPIHMRVYVRMYVHPSLSVMFICFFYLHTLSDCLVILSISMYRISHTTVLQHSYFSVLLLAMKMKRALILYDDRAGYLDLYDFPINVRSNYMPEPFKSQLKQYLNSAQYRGFKQEGSWSFF